MSALRVTKLERQDDGHYQATVHCNGDHVRVDNRYGSWQAQFGRDRREVAPRVAAYLQARLPRDARGRR